MPVVSGESFVCARFDGVEPGLVPVGQRTDYFTQCAHTHCAMHARDTLHTPYAVHDTTHIRAPRHIATEADSTNEPLSPHVVPHELRMMKEVGVYPTITTSWSRFVPHGPPNTPLL